MFVNFQLSHKPTFKHFKRSLFPSDAPRFWDINLLFVRVICFGVCAFDLELIVDQTREQNMVT